jgi:integrase
MLRQLLSWLGKEDVMRPITDILPAEAVRRTHVAKENKSFVANGVDALMLIEKAKMQDERLACMLALQYHFGLRVKESVEIRPERIFRDGGNTIEIFEGTKGGRPRRIGVTSEAQRSTLEWALRLARSGRNHRLRWPDVESWEKGQDRYYNRLRNWLGVSKRDMGVTSHGLRHEFAQRQYEQETGYPSPIQGGAAGEIDRQTHERGAFAVSAALGHGRKQVTASYYGSYGHQTRKFPEKPATNYAKNGVRWDDGRWNYTVKVN